MALSFYPHSLLLAYYIWLSYESESFFYYIFYFFWILLSYISTLQLHTLTYTHTYTNAHTRACAQIQFYRYEHSHTHRCVCEREMHEYVFFYVCAAVYWYANLLDNRLFENKGNVFFTMQRLKKIPHKNIRRTTPTHAHAHIANTLIRTHENADIPISTETLLTRD